MPPHQQSNRLMLVTTESKRSNIIKVVKVEEPNKTPIKLKWRRDPSPKEKLASVSRKEQQ